MVPPLKPNQLIIILDFLFLKAKSQHPKISIRTYLKATPSISSAWNMCFIKVIWFLTKQMNSTFKTEFSQLLDFNIYNLQKSVKKIDGTKLVRTYSNMTSRSSYGTFDVRGLVFTRNLKPKSR